MLARKIKARLLGLLMILLFSQIALGYMVKINDTPRYFEYKRDVTIQGSKVPNSQTNFPVLFDSKTDPSDLQLDLRTEANEGHVRSDDGYDIVFATADEQEILKHEIEKYVPSSGEYIAWVKADLNGDPTNTTIFIYYGISVAPFDTQHVADVWATNYVGVWHLKETTGGSGAIKDSTSWGNHGTDTNSPTLGVTGQIGNAINFNGSNERITIPHHSSLNLTTGITMQAWVNIDNPSYWDGIMSKGDWDEAYSLYTYEDFSGAEVWHYLVGVYWETDTNSNISEDWQFLAVSWNANNPINTIIQNQVVHSTSNRTGPMATVLTDFTIASCRFIYHFPGTIDEVRLSDIGRTQEWLETEFNNQDDPGSFYTVGDAYTTLVELSYFKASALDCAVLLEWATETELENEGFNLWRSGKENGEYVRINPYFIPAKGEAGSGAEYSYTDYDVTNGVIYYYKLEDIDINGKSSFHGPVSATPNDIILIWPDEWEILPSGGLSLSWASSGNYSFKVEISPSPSFAASKTLAFPEGDWTSGLYLGIKPEQWEMILRRAQESGGQLFWRVRAMSEDGSIIYSDRRRLVVERPKLPIK
jgi:hypothetical protein